MNILKLLKIFNDNYKTTKTRVFLKSRHNKFIKSYPQLAIFAFDRIGLEISLMGIYERTFLECLKKIIFNKIDTKKSICLDIGSNIGNHTLYFAQFFEKVFSFEPHPEIFELLKFNIRKSNNIEIFQFGLSNQNAEKIILTEQDTSYGSSLLKDIKKTNSLQNSNKFNVNVETFDYFSKNINLNKNISFIKLDVEDHELEVLQGMQKTLEQNSPTICFEQHKKQFDYFNKEISSQTIIFLKKIQYKYFYELPIKRKWRFNSNYSFINKFFKIIEIIFFGLPDRPKKLIPIKIFLKQQYLAIIASKTLLD